MFYRFRAKRQKARFYRLTRAVLETPPMPVVDAPLSIVSMVANGDVQMYLLAMKSFYRHVRRGKLVAIVDRDIPSLSRDTLRLHFPGIEFIVLEDIDVGACQRGGTWERLVYVLDRAEHEYTIQLDCDTLTFGADIREVFTSIDNNVAFALSSLGLQIKSLADAAVDAQSMKSNYVGIAAERLFDRYPDAANFNYVRGSSGFAGFSKGGFPRRRIEEFHRNMEALMPARWKEWGTEQCGSNFAIANTSGSVVLPHPKYASFGATTKRDDGAFLHFIGSYRYDGDFFSRLGQIVIGQLMRRE
jgi:hypothetical protein